ncbi:MAG TPA: hypothetical protein VHZ24_16745 [Pirellulales bacterium]|nr:hypothetical protein [Pirellulales bacterium]
MKPSNTHPQPIQTLLQKKSDGIRFSEDEGWLQIAPCPLEVVGGADDGESVYPFYSLHVANLIEVFDAVPQMLWTTIDGQFSLEGKIDGDDAWITFHQAPFEDEEPRDVLDPKGGIRPKQPPEE